MQLPKLGIMIVALIAIIILVLALQTPRNSETSGQLSDFIKIDTEIVARFNPFKGISDRFGFLDESVVTKGFTRVFNEKFNIRDSLIVRLNLKSGIPANYVFRDGLMTISVASPASGFDRIRINLTDEMVGSYPELKQDLVGLNVSTVAFIKRCAPEYLGFECMSRPYAYIQLNEQLLGQYIELLYPFPPHDRHQPGGVIDRDYESIITYKGIRYAILIGVTWTPP